MKGVPHALVLHSELTDPDIVAPLANGARLLAHVNRGRLTPTHSPGEHKLLRAALGRALTYPRYASTDIGAAVVPALRASASSPTNGATHPPCSAPACSSSRSIAPVTWTG